MVWCSLGNREVDIRGGLVVDEEGRREFSIKGPCEACVADFGLSSQNRHIGVPYALDLGLLGDEQHLDEEFLMAVLVNVIEDEVVSCEIDEVL